MFFDKIVNSHSVRMSKRGGSTSFPTEAFNCAEIILIQGAQYFNCHMPLYAVVPAFEDACHPSCGDMFKNLVSSSNPYTFKLVQRFYLKQPGRNAPQGPTTSLASIPLLSYGVQNG